MQFVDDVMDFTSSSAVMGKPALNDLKSGLATAPVLYAAEEYPELSPLILRRFKNPGDVELAEKLVFQSRGLQRTRELAAEHSELAAQAVSIFSFLSVSSAAFPSVRWRKCFYFDCPLDPEFTGL